MAHSNGAHRPYPLPELDPRQMVPGTDMTLWDLYRRSFPDPNNNTTRGLLVQGLVSHQLGEDEPGQPWAAVDVFMDLDGVALDAPVDVADGHPRTVRVGVRQTSRIQSWAQNKLNMPQWSGLSSRPESEPNGDSRLHVDVAVLAVLPHTDPATFEPLMAVNANAYEWYVVPAWWLLKDALSRAIPRSPTVAALTKLPSLTPSRVRKQWAPVGFARLADAVAAAYAGVAARGGMELLWARFVRDRAAAWLDGSMIDDDITKALCGAKNKADQRAAQLEAALQSPPAPPPPEPTEPTPDTRQQHLRLTS